MMDKKEFGEIMKLLVDKFDLYCRTKDGIKDGDDLSTRMTNYYYKRCVKSLEDRKAEFIEMVRPFVPEVGRETANEFVKYWNEHSPKGWKLRWEKEETFDVKRRLATWVNNSKKFNSINLANKILGSKLKQ